MKGTTILVVGLVGVIGALLLLRRRQVSRGLIVPTTGSMQPSISPPAGYTWSTWDQTPEAKAEIAANPEARSGRGHF